MKKKRMPNGSGTLKQRKDGRWESQLVIGRDENNKIKRKSFYGKTKQEAFEKMSYYKEQNNLTTTRASSDMLVSDYIMNWLNVVKRTTLKPISYDKMEDSIKKHIIPYIGDIPIKQLNSFEIQDLIVNRMKDDGLALLTIKKTYGIVKASLEHAVGSQIVFNPANKVELPRDTGVERKEIKTLSSEKNNGETSEIERFKEVCLSKNKSNDLYTYRHGPLFIFMMNTGLRIGEILALRWSDIDFDKREMTIRRNSVRIKERDSKSTKKTKIIEQDTPKTKSGNRTIPLNKAAITNLNMLKDANFIGDNALVVHNGRGEPLTTQGISRSYKGILKRANIESSGLHTLRHTFATQLFAKGVKVNVVSKLLGHSDVTVTYNTYIHVLENADREAVDAIEEI